MKGKWLPAAVLLLARMVGVVYGLFGLLILPSVGYFVLGVTFGERGYELLADWRVVGFYTGLLLLSACGFGMMYLFLALRRRGRYVALVAGGVLILLLGVLSLGDVRGMVPVLWLAFATAVTGMISLAVICYVPSVRDGLKKQVGGGVPR